MATRPLMKSVKYWTVCLAVVWLAALAATGVKCSRQELGRQDQARHAVGIAELFAHPCGAAEGFLRETGFRCRSHSDGRGFGSAGAAQPGD